MQRVLLKGSPKAWPVGGRINLMTRCVQSNSRSRSLVLVLGFALAAVVATSLVISMSVDAQEDRPTLLGLATHWDLTGEDVDALVAEAGKPPAMYQSFWDLEMGWDDSQFASLLESYESLGMSTYIELTTDDLGALNSGNKDTELDQIVRVVGNWVDGGSSRYVLIAPLAEANLPEHPWGADPAGYQAGYRRIQAAFRDAGVGPDQVRFVFAMNGLSGTGFSYEQFYPGNEVVDIIGFSKLNRGGNFWRDYDETFTRHIDEMQDEISRIKPIIITQTGSVDDSNGDRDQWLDDMFSGLANEAQVIGAFYFNRDKDFDFRVVADGNVDSAFSEGYKTWSPPSEVSWIFDGRMDAWVTARAEEIVFDDIGSTIFAEDILWVASQGITLGCAPFEYCPNDPVSRGQMASFMKRALNLPDSSKDWFTDDDGSTHEPSINSVADAGITLGCGGDLYCPADLITRAQMASFLARALGLTEAVPPPATALMAIEDLVFTGAFRLKNGDFGVSNINYAVGALAYNSNNDSLFIVGHATQSAVAEFPIPEPGMQGEVAELPESSDPLQSFVDLLGATADGNPDSLDRITGMMVVDGALIVNAETWYDAAGDNTYTTLFVPDADNLDVAVNGFYRVDGAAHSAGYMSPIPAAYQEVFGAEYLTGWSSVYSIVSRYSVGPSLWTFDPADLTAGGLTPGGSVSATPLMNFGFSEGMLGDRAVEYAPQGEAGPFEPASPLWNILSKGRYGFIVPGTRTFAVRSEEHTSELQSH